MGYYYRWEEFPLKEVSYLKGRPEASRLLIRIVIAPRKLGVSSRVKVPVG
jgi:hypothetical protein